MDQFVRDSVKRLTIASAIKAMRDGERRTEFWRLRAASCSIDRLRRSSAAAMLEFYLERLWLRRTNAAAGAHKNKRPVPRHHPQRF
jgi:hypothetical protein